MHGRIGRYEVLDPLGRGGMGVVFRARDPRDGRLVALKVLTSARGADPAQRARFAREVQLLLRLRHPNVVTLLDVGEDQGAPFMVLELVDGGTLDERIARGGPLPEREAAALTLALARAMSTAHGEGVVHRDLKPSNVLLDAATGAPRLTDFGLAKDLDPTRSAMSQTGQFLGTPGFWAPEQAAGAHAHTGPTTDVYGLGALLYAALTGEPPIRGQSLVEILTDTQDRAPDPPSSARPGLDARLEAICLRCLAKAPDARYPTADALAADLERFLEGEPTPSRSRRAWLALAGAALAASGLALAVGARWPAPAPAPAATTSGPRDLDLARFRRSDGTFEVTSDLRIGPEERLVVPAGATLRFAPDVAVLVSGTLRCDGAEGAPVVLGGDGWRGVTIAGAGARAELAWTRLEGATKDEGGGALVLDGGALVARDVAITGCRARDGAGLLARGRLGAAATVELVRCRLEDNHAAGDGGGLHVSGEALVALRACEVVGNGAAHHGGGLEMRGALEGGLGVVCEDVLLRRNTSVQGGGANVLRATLELRGGELSENVAAGEAGDGGGVNLLGTDRAPARLEAQDVRIVGNRAERNGGGLNVNRHAAAALRGCALVANRAARHGGAVIALGAGGPSAVTCVDTSFTSNGATRGGALEVESATLLLRGGALVDNEAVDEPGDGGAVHVQGVAALAQAVLEDVRLEKNRAAGRGGGVAIFQRAEVTMRRCEVVGNRARSGAGVFARFGEAGAPRLMTLGVALRGNVAERGGGLVLDGATGRLEGGALAGNEARGEPGDGGGVLAVGDADHVANLDCDGVRFEGNAAARNGGALNVNTHAAASLRGCVLVSNRAEDQGGALFVFGRAERPTEVTCFDTSFERNAAEVGGAIRLARSTIVTLRACRLSGNEARTYGGAAAALGKEGPSELVCFGTRLEGNRAAEEGGALNVNVGARARLEGCQLFENAAGDYGGGVCTIGDPARPAVLALVGCEFARNTAPDGRGPDLHLGRHTEHDPAQLAACGLDDPARCSSSSARRD